MSYCIFCGANETKVTPFVNEGGKCCCDICLKGLYSGSLMTTVTTYKKGVGVPFYSSHDVKFIPSGALVIGCEEEL